MKIGLPKAGFALYKDTSGVDIRKSPALLSDRTGERVEFSGTFAFSSTASIQHKHSDGKEYSITFFELIDGRGWVHDFVADRADEQPVIIMV